MTGWDNPSASYLGTSLYTKEAGICHSERSEESTMRESHHRKRSTSLYTKEARGGGCKNKENFLYPLTNMGDSGTMKHITKFIL